MQSPLTVDASQIRPLLDMAEGSGVPMAAILKRLRLPPAEASTGTVISLADYYRLRHEIALALDDETCQLSSRQLLSGSTDFILSHFAGSSSLYDAMKVIARSYNLLHGGEYNSVRKRKGVVTFVIDNRNFPYTLKDQAEHIRFETEAILIFLHGLLMTISAVNARAGLRGVSVTRRRGEGKADHLAFWPAPVRFGSAIYALDYDADLAKRRFTVPPSEHLTSHRVNTRIIDMIAERENAGPAAEDIEGLVREALGAGVIDQRAVAGRLGVSVATLRRRLAEEKTSFRNLRKDVLNRAAQSLLRKRRPIADVAEELGFSEFRSFNRAFKEWNGMTPKAYVATLDGDRNGNI